MQTFVPYGAEFKRTAEVLDPKRLGKQRVETWQIIKALTEPTYGWKHHPAVKMWSGHVPALAVYGAEMSKEWIRRGYKDTMLDRFYDVIGSNDPAEFPSWLFDQSVVVSHRSNLIRKYPEWYQQVWPNTPNDIPYVWPKGEHTD